ncbi:MAG: hypothetical protein ABIH23_23660 [bacterium]
MATATHPEQLRNEYLQRVSNLFDKVRQWVSEFDPNATFQEEETTIREVPIEPYEVHCLVIDRPGYKQVRLIPRGCQIIGAEGRVDMKSDLGTETLVYVWEGGPHIVSKILSQNGEVLHETSRAFVEDVTEGWVHLENRQSGPLPALDANLFRHLMEVLS